MTRIPLDPPRSPLIRLTEWYSRRRFGAVLEPGAAIAHNPRVLRTYIRTSRRWPPIGADSRPQRRALAAHESRPGCSLVVGRALRPSRPEAADSAGRQSARRSSTRGGTRDET